MATRTTPPADSGDLITPIWPLWDGRKALQALRPVRCIPPASPWEAVMLEASSDVASKCHQREVVRGPPFRMCILKKMIRQDFFFPVHSNVQYACIQEELLLGWLKSEFSSSHHLTFRVICCCFP